MGYNLNFKSCWGDLGFSYKTGQCTSHLKDVVSQSYSSTKHSINKFVHGSTTDGVTTAKKKENLVRLDGPLPSIAFLVGNETHNFTTSMFKIATEPIKTTKDVLQNAIDLA